MTTERPRDELAGGVFGAPPAPPAPAAPTLLPAFLAPDLPGGGAALRRGDAVTAFLLALLLLTAFAGVRDLWDSDEGRYAGVALDMKRANDLVTPRENGMRFVDKPPLLYWMTIGAYHAFGVTPFAARFADIVAGAAWCAIAFAFAGQWTGRRRAAWYAAMIGATCLGGMGFSRSVTTDMPLSACVAGALLAAWHGLRSDGWRPRVALGVAVGLGLLAKGALGAVLPALVGFTWAALGVRWDRVLRLLVSPLAWLTALVVAAPWYAVMEMRNPGYLAHFVLYEHWGRFSKAGRSFAPVWLYAVTLLGFLIPWPHLLWKARIRHVITGAWLRGPRAGERFAWGWALSVLVLISIGKSRLYTYILPALLPLVVIVAARLDALLSDPDPRPARRLAWLTAIPALLGIPVAILGWTGAPYHWNISQLGDPRGAAAAGPVVFGALGLAAMPLLFRLLRTPRSRATALVLASAALLYSVDLGLASVDVVRSPRELASILAREQRDGADVVCLDVFPQGLRFYEDVFFKVAGKQGEIVPPWSEKDGKGILLTEEELLALWRGPTRVVLAVREGKSGPYARGSAELLASKLSGGQKSDLMVLSNRPKR